MGFIKDMVNDREMVKKIWSELYSPDVLIVYIFIERAMNNKVNVEEDIDLSTLMGIRSVPAIKYIKEGEVVSTTIGLKSAKEINNLITENMS